MIIIPKPGTLWMHIASLKVYRVVCIANMESDYSKVVVYKKAHSETPEEEPIWVRPVKEWASRFEYVREIL